ncbi:hypothetical protein L1987_19208 [Smallanthus sonchifolius]|uniref:Uncharacterized protein n=1 Tax=Smallanthus sonchifolius TaxID=185202 RepID=A0ACB9IP77_9ASTR|nr:hypothetical protein L1987_19208 [Smallanthus sonchifolius]
MDSLNQTTLTPNKTRLSRTFAKVLHIQNTKSSQKVKHVDKPITDVDQYHQDEKTMDAFVAKVFATVSSVKAAYAQLQVAQSPYDPEGIQSADQIMVSELKRLSEFKQMFLKNHLHDDVYAPETIQILAEIQEQKSLIQMYEITTKKLDSQKKLKDSEIIFLKEKINEAHKENKMIERRFNFNLSSHEKFKFNFSSLTVNNFLPSLQQTTRSVKIFVRFMMREMEDANWDLTAAASSIQPNVVFWETAHKCFAFESFVCRVMFDGFNNPGFSITNDGSPRFFFDSFMELKSLKSREYITWKPNSMFAKFCWLKYLKLVHPIMESSLFGNLNQRNQVSAGKFPETEFFASFADVARRVWLLHCLSFAFDSGKPSIFQVREGSRFTEVFMESVNEELVKTLPEVGFTVVPGFKVGGSVIQCQVYLTCD